MPGEIQTSFIPKAPMTAAAKPARPASVGVMTVISLVLVLAAVASFAGSFIYREVLKQNIAQLETNIESIQNNMPIATLQEIEDINNRLNRADTLLAKHTSSTRVFTLIQDITIPTIRYTNFSFSNGEVSLEGVARNYEDIAAQANVFKARPELVLVDFANFVVDQKTKLVSFNLNMTIDPTAFAYQGVATRSTLPPSNSTSTATTP